MNIPATTVWRFRGTRGGYDPISGSEIYQYIYNPHQPGTKTAIPRVDATPRGVETPTPLADR